MKLKNDMVNLIVRVEHHLCPLYCGVVDRRRIIAFLLLRGCNLNCVKACS